MKDILYAHQIETAVKENNIQRWYPFNCSICGKDYGFNFYNGIVTFSGNCDCSSAFGERQSSYKEILQIYNDNMDNEMFKNKFYKFFNLK